MTGVQTCALPISQNRPLIVVAKQAVGRTAHMHQVFRIGPYAAQNTENRLDEGWALHQPAIHEVGQIVKVAYVVALELETCRSEEHTSELQSLLRISYAVFCLKKKKL